MTNSIADGTTVSPWLVSQSDLLRLVLLIEARATLRALGVDSLSLWKLFIDGSAMDIFIKDWVVVYLLELGLEVLQTSRVAAAVGSATSIGHIEARVLDLFTINTPVALASAILLCLLRVLVGETALGEVTGEVFFGSGRAIGQTGVVAVIEFV